MFNILKFLDIQTGKYALFQEKKKNTVNKNRVSTDIGCNTTKDSTAAIINVFKELKKFFN